MATKIRNICFTSFKSEINVVMDQVVYLVYGYETCPDTKRKHLQGFIQLRNNYALKGIKKILGDDSAHIEPMRGTAEEASTYCKKDENFKEFGTLRSQGDRTDLKEIKKNLIEGDTLRSVVLDKCENFQQIKYAESLAKYILKQRDWEMTVIWICGAPGCGKSRLARQDYPDAFWAGSNLKWWNGYDGEETVVIDDFRSTSCDLAFFLRLTDRYPFTVETKGGIVAWVPKTIVITSVKPPHEEFAGWSGEDLSQVTRRINKIINLPAPASASKSEGNTTLQTFLSL